MKTPLLLMFIGLFILDSFWGNLNADNMISIQATASGQISLSAQDATLGNLCKELSKKTKSSIRIPKEWQEQRIFIAFEDKNLLDSLNLVLKTALLNYAIHEMPAENLISITIFGHDRLNGIVKTSTERYTSTDTAITDIRDLEVVPPDKPGGKSITQRDIDQIHANLETIDPLDLEVVPPDKPGEKSITQRELNQIYANMETIDPLDLEVVPPDKPGEKSITQRELNELNNRRE